MDFNPWETNNKTSRNSVGMTHINFHSHGKHLPSGLYPIWPEPMDQAGRSHIITQNYKTTLQSDSMAVQIEEMIHRCWAMESFFEKWNFNMSQWQFLFDIWNLFSRNETSISRNEIFFREIRLQCHEMKFLGCTTISPQVFKSLRLKKTYNKQSIFILTFFSLKKYQ